MIWMQRHGQNRIPAVKATIVCFRKTDTFIVSAVQYYMDLMKDVCKNAGRASKLVNSTSGRLRKIL